MWLGLPSWDMFTDFSNFLVLDNLVFLWIFNLLTNVYESQQIFYNKYWQNRPMGVAKLLEHSITDCEIKGLNPATDCDRVKMKKSFGKMCKNKFSRWIVHNLINLCYFSC
jgi:hypothetical protein